MCQGLIQRLDMRLFSEIRSPGDVVSNVFAERVHAHRFGLDAKFCQPFFQAWILQGFTIATGVRAGADSPTQKRNTAFG